MSLTIKLTFPAGRYHATPWGRHVNEGAVEWPPSPWRLLRALVAVWRRTLPDLPAEDVERLLRELAHPPRFRLPAHRTAHVRHYMPWEKKGPADRTLVFDTFVVLDRLDAVHLTWPDFQPTDDQRRLLALLLARLTYLGRAESWVQAELDDDPPDWNCSPLDPASSAGQAGETGDGANRAAVVDVLCADPVEAFTDEHLPGINRKRPDSFLFDAPRWHLCIDTEALHAQKWPFAPGSKVVPYERREPAPPRAAASVLRRTGPAPTVVRFLLDAPVLPLAVDTLPVADCGRSACMGAFWRWCERHAASAEMYVRQSEGKTLYASPVLSGKDRDGVPLAGHGHAHYLPSAEGDDPRRITHLTLYAPQGFEPLELAALRSLRYVDLKQEPRRLFVQLVGLGRPADFTSPLFQTSTRWRSTTPYVAPRHFKRRGRKSDLVKLDGADDRTAFAALTLAELVEKQGLPPVRISPSVPETGAARPHEYRRSRKRDDGLHRAFGWFELEFERPVAGPLCLGYGSHFGLGQFTAVKES